jgi:hypothetical protein
MVRSFLALLCCRHCVSRLGLSCRGLGLSGVRSSRWAGMFAFGNGKYEEAAELYGQAAKQYQLGKNCESPPLLLPARAPETET